MNANELLKIFKSAVGPVLYVCIGSQTATGAAPLVTGQLGVGQELAHTNSAGPNALAPHSLKRFFVVYAEGC